MLDDAGRGRRDAHTCQVPSPSSASVQASWDGELSTHTQASSYTRASMRWCWPMGGPRCTPRSLPTSWPPWPASHAMHLCGYSMPRPTPRCSVATAPMATHGPPPPPLEGKGPVHTSIWIARYVQPHPCRPRARALHMDPHEVRNDQFSAPLLLRPRLCRWGTTCIRTRVDPCAEGPRRGGPPGSFALGLAVGWFLYACVA